MKKYVIFLVVSVVINLVSEAQQVVYYERTDTTKVQVVVSKTDDVYVNPTYNSIFGKDEWNTILNNDKGESKELSELLNTLGLFDFTLVHLEWIDEKLILEFEKYTRTIKEVIKS